MIVQGEIDISMVKKFVLYLIFLLIIPATMILTLRYTDEYKLVRQNMWYARLVTQESHEKRLHVFDMSVGSLSYEHVPNGILSMNVHCVLHNHDVAIFLPLYGKWDNNLNKVTKIEFLND